MKTILALVLALALTACSSRGGVDTRPTGTPWELNFGSGTVVQPHPEGWSVDIPLQGGSTHYVTTATGPLTGKTLIRMRYRLEAAADIKLVPRNFPEAPSIITLYFQRAGDDWSARGEFEAYRWYAGFANRSPVVPGEFTLEAPLDGNWGAIMTSNRVTNPDGFAAALAGASRIGFVLGGGDGLGHGVYATGPARLVVLSFEVL